MALKFVWDKKKAKANLKKHNVSFEEAKTVFGDRFARISEDTLHSQYEQRWHIIGTSKNNRVIIVAYTERSVKQFAKLCFTDFLFCHFS